MVCATILSVSASARANPDGCPTSDEIDALVIDHAGTERAASWSASGIVITFEAAPDGTFRAVVETPAGSRSFEGKNCAEVADAAALVVALTWTESAMAGGDAGSLPSVSPALAFGVTASHRRWRGGAPLPAALIVFSWEKPSSRSLAPLNGPLPVAAETGDRADPRVAERAR
jgi:hypothetical protein